MPTNKKSETTVATNEENEAVITGTISAEAMTRHTAEALRFFSENLTLDGFRKGNIPESVIRKNVSDVAVLEETASRALNEIYPEVIREHAIDVFGRPQVSFTKLAPGNPVEFTVTVPLMPKIEIADYKAIAKELNATKPEVVLEEAEVTNALLEIRKELDRRESGKGAEEPNTKAVAGEEQEPSPLTDEKVQKISPMKTVLEFEESVRGDLKKHKENQADERHRLAIIEKILQESSVTLPKAIIDAELQSMMAQFASDVSTAGLKMEDYLKQAGKTNEEILDEWRPHAENRAKMQLLLNKMATSEDLFPKKDDVEHHLHHLLKHNPTADKERAMVYVETQLANASVFSFLESQK